MDKGMSEGWPAFMEVPGPKALSSVKLSREFGHHIEGFYQQFKFGYGIIPLDLAMGDYEL